MRSYCLRRRVSYSRPESDDSAGASRSFRRRGAERDTTGESEGSVHAGFLVLRIGFWGTGASEGREEDDSAFELEISDSDPPASFSSLPSPSLS
jgi:hypothetical protein